MSEPGSSTSSPSSIESELCFLIARFLSNGPCQRTAKVFLDELQENKLLPKRVDWEGREHFRSYNNLIEINPHISSDYLLKICQRLGPLVDKEVKPCITGVRSLLGAGQMSLLRTIEDLKETKWTPSQHIVLSHGNPVLPPANLALPNICHVLRAQELSGKSRKDTLFPSPLFSKLVLHDRKLGHLSAVYCIAFDRTGRHIFTGADDHLVKIWSVEDGRLLATFRGHSAEITDMAVNYENTLLAAGSCDKMIRVWCLKTKSPVAILHGHTGMITSVQFCPQSKGDNRILLSTGADGCVCFWTWNISTNKFNSKPIKFVERSRAGARMLCSSFSPGGMFLATGNSDHVIRVYFLHSSCPEKICELEVHKDRVDSIAYSNHSINFVSGSQDGTARIWRYERQEWRAMVLNMNSPRKIYLTPRVSHICWPVKQLNEPTNLRP
ncbi:bromodomain and WD repeat-containing protein 3 isoform X3 [Patella vulgata]|uniref:bromodomain and WD repeat-containing protein 3 isoform X3 n=1 Tax=Patella vulgata TaxID=6465 RepID=UPI00218079A0|nr:bromodomain and WD repeat-containing protein 3 isoform X3 [Patella vulgata]